MNSHTYNAVIGFVSKFTGCDSSHIAGETRLGEDLGIDGDDAAEFMRAFAERFSVDLTSFKLARHFGPEAGWNPAAAVYYLIAGNQLEPISIDGWLKLRNGGRGV